MNDPTGKRRAQVRALKDAMVAQVVALSDDEVAQEAQRQGVDLHTVQARVRAVHDKAVHVAGSGTTNTVVALEAVRPPVTDQGLSARHRLARSMRLAASVDPPSNPRATDAKEQTDRPSSTADKGADRSKP